MEDKEEPDQEQQVYAKALRMRECLDPGGKEVRLVWPEIREQRREWKRLWLGGHHGPGHAEIH